MIDVLKGLGIFIFGSTGVYCLLFAYQILRGNRQEYERNRRRIGGFPNLLSGKVRTVSDGGRDYRVAAGIAIDRDNRWVEQGRLSREAILSALRRPQ